MMKLSSRLQHIERSVTLAITARAKQLRQEGMDVVNFAAGEPDFDTPDFIKDAAIQSIRDGFTKYTPTTGTPELKELISQKFKNDNGLDYPAGQIVVSCGAKHSLYNIFQALCQEGDEVIIGSPYWVSYPEMVKLSGATPVIIPAKQDNDFKILPQELKKAISSKTKAIIINSPSNPTGTIYNKSELQKIADICVNSKIAIISDEIYEKLIYDNEKHVSIGSLGKDVLALTITVNGVSKAFSMTGWRIGYLGGPTELIEAISKVQDHSTSNPTSISQKATCVALRGDKGFSQKIREEFEKRRNLMCEMLKGITKITFVPPKGAFYIFCNISKTGYDSFTFAKNFLENEKVAVIPGGGFGCDDFIRLSFATGTENIKKGIERLAKWLKQ